MAYAESGWAGNIIPSANITYDLGNATNRWNDIWLANSTIHLGEVSISATGANLQLPTTVKIGNVTLSESGGNLALPENISANTVVASGNITGNFILGNGSQLTGLPATYANANVASFLSNGFGSNTISTTGNITGGNINDSKGEVRLVPINSQSASYTLTIEDAGRTILHPLSDNNNRTFTIPANSSVAYPIGTVLTFINQIATVSISINSDTLYLSGAGSTGTRSLTAWGVATAIKLTSTTWIISGNNLS